MPRTPARGLVTGLPVARPAADAGPLDRAMLTRRAEGAPVRGYRSRKGRTWPGFTPLVPARPDVTAAVPMAERVPEGTYRMPVTIRDVRTLPAFTTMTAARAVTIVRSAERHGAIRPNRAAALLASVRERTVVRA